MLHVFAWVGLLAVSASFVTQATAQEAPGAVAKRYAKKPATKKSRTAVRPAGQFQPSLQPAPPAGPRRPMVVPSGQEYLISNQVPTPVTESDYPVESVAPAGDSHNFQMGCDTKCGPDCTCKKCCALVWPHKCSVWGGFLYLHAGDVDMAHAIQQNGTGGAGTVPDGRVGVAAPDYEPAFVVGGNIALSGCTSVWASFTHFESSTSNSLEAPPGVGGTVSSLVLHPGTINAGSTTSLVDATYDIDFELVDINLMRLLSASRMHAINYHVGARYGMLDQEFQQIGVFAPPTGDLDTSSRIHFEGVGPRVGLDGRANLGRCGFSVYGNTFATFLIGKFDSRYEQFNFTTTTREAFSEWNDNRMVPQVETEVGLAWTNCKGCLRLSVGYQLQWWFNAVTVGEHIRAVQNNNFVNVGDTIAFDGLTSRVEWRF